MLKETKILNRQRSENIDHNERVSLSTKCSSRKSNHACLFLWLYPWRLSQENHNPTPGLQREQGVHFFSSGKRACLGFLSGSMGSRNDIIPSWKSLAGFGAIFVPFLESDAPRMTDCSERKLCRNLPIPLSFIQGGTEGQKAAWALTCKFAPIILMWRAVSRTASKQSCLNPHRRHAFRWNLSLEGFYTECSILSCFEGEYFMRRRGRMQMKGLSEPVLNQESSGELLR